MQLSSKHCAKLDQLTYRSDIKPHQRRSLQILKFETADKFGGFRPRKAIKQQKPNQTCPPFTDHISYVHAIIFNVGPLDNRLNPHLH